MAYSRPVAIQPGAATRPLPVGQFVGDTIGAAGQVTSIGATSTVVTLTPPAVTPSSGTSTWAFQICAGFGGGTPAAADINNMRLQLDGTTISVLALPALNGLYYFTFILTVNGSQAMVVQSVGAGTASVAYVAGIYATQMR